MISCCASYLVKRLSLLHFIFWSLRKCWWYIKKYLFCYLFWHNVWNVCLYSIFCCSDHNGFVRKLHIRPRFCFRNFLALWDLLLFLTNFTITFSKFLKNVAWIWIRIIINLYNSTGKVVFLNIDSSNAFKWNVFPF